MFIPKPHRNADGTDGAGAEPVIEVPPAPIAPDPVAELNARLAQLEQQNLAMQQQLMQRQLQAQQQAQPAEPELDLSQLDPTTRAYVAKINRNMEARLLAVQEQADQAAFLAEARANGLDQATVQEALQQHGAWRNAGAVINVNGESRTLSRFDALDFVLGRKQRAGLVDAAPMRNRKQVADAVLASLGSQRPGGGGAQPPVEMGYDELEALPVDQQMKILEDRINKAGGFSALP